MRSTSEYSNAFKIIDAQYLCVLNSSAQLDPLNFRAGLTLQPFQQRLDKPGDYATESAIETVIDWQSSAQTRTEAEIYAAQRDYDKIQSCLVATGVVMTERYPQAIQAANWFLQQTKQSPRASVYNYTLGNTADRKGTYTNTDEETNLIDILAHSLTAAHSGIGYALDARAAMLVGNAVQGEQSLGQLHAAIKTMHGSLRRIPAEVTPQFVAHELGKYTKGLTLGNATYEGPNPSHSGFLTLDRFVLGSMEELFNNSVLARHFEYRQTDMPRHLGQLAAAADLADDKLSLVELAITYAPECTNQSRAITAQLKKFKMAHRSYADKSRIVKQLLPKVDSPDLLSATIEYTAAKEQL